MARVAPTGRITKSKPLKRRRPAKKLNTDIGSLADALPDVSPKPQQGARVGEGKMKMKSIRHRPGAMKRKQRMQTAEMERFGKNLAQLVGTSAADGNLERVLEEKAVAGTGSSLAARWKALRTFIGGTMEKDEAFQKKT